MTDERQWRSMGRPGFFGKKKPKMVAEYDRKYGPENWRIVWVASWKVIEQYAEFDSAILEYEKAYYLYLQSNMDIVHDIIKFKEVYDNDETNVYSGINYNVQETTSNHYQDISIRRCLARLGLWFRGEKDELLHVRSNSKQALGRMLSPGKIPFHFKKLIKKPELKGWWDPLTVESYWQSNKTLQVKEDALL